MWKEVQLLKVSVALGLFWTSLSRLLKLFHLWMYWVLIYTDVHFCFYLWLDYIFCQNFSVEMKELVCEEKKLFVTPTLILLNDNLLGRRQESLWAERNNNTVSSFMFHKDTADSEQAACLIKPLSSRLCFMFQADSWNFSSRQSGLETATTAETTEYIFKNSWSTEWLL